MNKNMKISKLFIYASLAAAIPMISSCSDDSDTDLGALTIKEAVYNSNHMELRLQDNETLPLTVFTMPNSKENVNATFTTRHPEWLTVEDGVLKPTVFSGGETIYDPVTRTDTLTVSAGGLSTSYVVVITNHIKRVSEIKLTAAGANIELKRGGKTFNLAATMSFAPADAYNKNVTYTSSNEEVAKVSPEGIITSVEEGSAVITIAATDGSGVTRTANVSVLGIQPVALDRKDWTVTNCVVLESTGFDYKPKSIYWVPDKVTVNGVPQLTGDPASMFDGVASTFFAMVKPGKNMSTNPKGWGAPYEDLYTNLITEHGGDPAAGTSQKADANAEVYFIIDMKKEEKFSQIIWRARSGSYFFMTSFDFYGSNDPEVYTKPSAQTADKWEKLNSEPFNPGTEQAELKLDINNGQEFTYRYVKVVGRSFSGPTGNGFGIAEFNLMRFE